MDIPIKYRYEKLVSCYGGKFYERTFLRWLFCTPSISAVIAEAKPSRTKANLSKAKQKSIL